MMRKPIARGTEEITFKVGNCRYTVDVQNHVMQVGCRYDEYPALEDVYWKRKDNGWTEYMEETIEDGKCLRPVDNQHCVSLREIPEIALVLLGEEKKTALKMIQQMMNKN
jgi:hypothetical protein